MFLHGKGVFHIVLPLECLSLKLYDGFGGGDEGVGLLHLWTLLHYYTISTRKHGVGMKHWRKESLYCCRNRMCTISQSLDQFLSLRRPSVQINICTNKYLAISL